eukprot:g64896.t1
MDGKIFFMNFGANDNVALKSYKGGRGVNVLALVSADYRFRWHNQPEATHRKRLEWPPEDSRQAINEPQEESLAMRPIILVDGTFAGSPVLQKPYPVAQRDLPSKLLFNKIHDSVRLSSKLSARLWDGLESLHSQYDGSLSLRPRTLPM